MNHKAGADETEVFEVIEVDPFNRKDEISEPFEIEGFTKFTFPIVVVNTPPLIGAMNISMVPITMPKREKEVYTAF